MITDLKKYEDAAISKIYRRIGSDIPKRNLQRILANLLAEGTIGKTGKFNQAESAKAIRFQVETSANAIRKYVNRLRI